MIAYSLEPPVSEEQFLQRELGITWQQVSANQLSESLGSFTSNLRTLVLVSEPGEYFSLLSAAAADSVVLLLISDERYAPERLQLAKLPAVHSIYRHYGVRAASHAQVSSAITGFFADARGTQVPSRSALPLLGTGFKNRKRMTAWRTERLTEMPLGYTNAFAAALSDAASTSLLTAPDPCTAPARDIEISFRGNRGLAPRILGMDRAAQIPGSQISAVDAAWSAIGGREAAVAYVNELQRSRFALCPPGFANSESFRYYEALICGALPVELTTSITHLGIAPHREESTIQAASWVQALKIAQAMSEKEREDRVQRAREHLVRELSAIRDSLAQDLEV